MTLGTESPYISRDDESEAAQLKDIYGVGEVQYLEDEDVKNYSMADFGMGMREEIERNSR